MNETLTPTEVLDIARQMERNGVAFYSRAAELFDQPTPRVVFRTLAEREMAHEKIYAQMQQRLSESRQIPPADQEGPSLRAMAGLGVFGLYKDPHKQLTGQESIAQIIRVAIRNEKDSIVFYTGLKDFIHEDAGIRAVNEVIHEEMRHIRMLSESLEQYE